VLLIVSLLLVVLLLVVFVKSKVEAVPVKDVLKDVPVDVFDVAVEDVSVEDVPAKDVPADVKNTNAIEVSEEDLETLYQVLSSRSQRAEGPESKGRKPRSKPRSQGKKTYVSCPSVVIIEEETEAELLARKFDEQLYGRRASKRKANYWDLKPVGRRPRDNKEKGDFRQDRRLKASRQKAVVESRTAYSPLVPIYVVGIREGLIP
jgi:hypothetical protein